MTEPLETLVRPSLALDFGPTFGVLRHGPLDPTVRIRPGEVWRATRTPLGPATLRLWPGPDGVAVQAWGPGASWVIERAPDLCGARDDLLGWAPARHPLVRELDRRLGGLRMIATGAVLEAAVPTVLEQKVTSAEAHTSWARLVASWGESAPGPAGLRLPPAARRLSAEPYHAFHRFGVERRRADVIRRLAARASRVEEAARLPAAQRRGRLEAFPGVGAWTSAEVAAVAWADADAVAVGDYHLAKLVVFAFTGRRGGDDDAMLELLEPFRPHRGRVARMVMLACDRPSRRAPRAPLRDFRAW